MGSSDHCCGVSRLTVRCFYGAAVGFVIAILVLMAALWILWCYFGLTIVQISDSQRRALVNYSYTPAKPTSSTPPYNLTVPPVLGDAASIESSLNYISKSATASTFLRGSSRDQPVTSPPHGVRNSDDDKKAAILSGALADGDDGIHLRRVSSTSSKADDNRPNKVEPPQKNDGLGGIEPKTPDIAPTQVDEKSSSNRDPSSRDERRTSSREYPERSHPPRRDEIQSSRRSDANPDLDRDYPHTSDRGRTIYDDDDDERGSRSRYDQRDRGRDTDDKYSKGDTRVYPNDEVRRSSRPSEDRYRDKMPPPKTDDERSLGTSEDRYRDRMRPLRDDDERPSRTSEDRYRDRMPPVTDDDEMPSRNSEDRYRDRVPPLKGDDERPSRTSEDRYRDRMRPLRDDDAIPSRTSEDRYRDRMPPSDYDRYTRYPEEQRPRSDDERYRTRDYEDRYRARDDRPRYREGDPRYKERIDEDRYSDGDRYRSRDERYRARDDVRYRPRDDDIYRDRTPAEKLPDRTLDDFDRDRYRSRGYDDRYKDDSRTIDRDGPDRLSEDSERNRYRPRGDYNRYRDDIRPRDPITSSKADDLPERSPVRQYSNGRGTSATRDSSFSRGDVLDTQSEKPFKDAPSEDRYRDRDDKYKRHDRIVPTRVEDETYVPRSTSVDSRARDVAHTSRSTLLDDRHIDNGRSRVRDTKYYDDRKTDNSREIAPSTVMSSRSISDDRDDYHTRLPEAKDVGRGDEVALDRRSYASEEDDDYRRISRTRSYDYDDRYKKVSSDDPNRDYRDEYSRRSNTDDDEYRSRGDYDSSRTRYRGRFDDEYRRYEDRDDRSDRSYDDRLRRDGTDLRKEVPSIRDSLAKDRPIYNDRSDRPRTRDDTSTRDSADRRIRLETTDELLSRPPGDMKEDRRYIDDPPPRYVDVALRETPPKSTSRRDPIIGSPMSPSDVVIREKRFQSTRDQSDNVSPVIEDRMTSSIRSGESQAAERPLNAKDVIEAALRQSDQEDQGSRKVFYPVFDPRVSNLTSPDVIRPSERRGTTINARKRRMTGI